MSDSSHKSQGGNGRRLLIVGLLVGAVALLYRFTAVRSGFDPSAMLALGFIVLASFVIGQLVEAIKLPHISGYLIAGLLFGPSVAQLIPASIAMPPFDDGILNKDVIDQLSVLDTLAVALIAMTAGGELKLDALRQGFAAIGGVLAGQVVALFIVIGGFMWLIGGAIPFIALPGLGELSTFAVLSLGAIVASISLATSPAATIAVINDVGAEGPMTRTLLATVVLKDVIVVVLFSIFSVLASKALGMDDGNSSLGSFLLVHIVGSLFVGIVLGLCISLYLRFVKREELLFLVAIVYTATLIGRSLDLDPVLLFIAAGFAASNFSREGDTLIHNVERLSMPVYVVFFTLAGAKLHLDHLAHVAPFALALVALRMAALKLGVGVGGKIGGASTAMREKGWLGFVSQAGVAISLAAIVGSTLGEVGTALETLIIAGVAINELIGPVLLKVGLSLSGEIGGSGASQAALPELESVGRGGRSEHGQGPVERLAPWPEPTDGQNPWGTAPNFFSRELNSKLRELSVDMRNLVRELRKAALDPFHKDADAYLRELRREFLRHHRRLMVEARTDMTEGNRELSAILHREQSELAERWRGVVLGRSNRMQRAGWTPTKTVETIDRLVESLPATIQAPYEDVVFEAPASQGAMKRVRRRWLRIVRGFVRIFTKQRLRRPVHIREIARYHLSGLAPEKLEAIAALLVQADVHIAARTRSLFEGIVIGYDRLAMAQLSVDGANQDKERKRRERDTLAALNLLRQDVEEELELAQTEINDIVKTTAHRAAQILGSAVRDVIKDATVVGGPDLSHRARRTSKVFPKRIKALSSLPERLERVRRSVGGEYALVALELELIALEARVKDALVEHVSALESDMRGRTCTQASRVETALDEALGQISRVLSDGSDLTGDDLAAQLRELTAPLEKVAGNAAQVSMFLRDQLTDETTVAPLLDALRRATNVLTDRYEVPSAPMQQGEWKLPPSVSVVEVPFRELVTSHIEAVVGPKMLTVTRTAANHVQPFTGSLQELERLVAFNVELAQSELDVVSDETVPDQTRRLLNEMIVGSLERTRDVFSSHTAVSQSWPDELAAGLRDAVLGGVEELRGQLVDGEISQLKLRVLQQTARGRRLIHTAGRIPRLVQHIGRLAHRTFESLVGSQRFAEIKESIGLPKSANTRDFGPDLFAPPSVSAELPMVYKRLFAAETLEAGDVLTGRENEIVRARHVLSGQSTGKLRAVALVGMDGVGKGALASAIIRSQRWRNVHRIQLRKSTTVEEVAAWFQSGHEGHLYVLGGMHWLIAMRPRGFEPLRRFVQGVIEDGGRNAWLVQADELVWEYGQQLAPLRDAFPETIHLAPLNASALEAAVLARHEHSGYGLNFQPEVGGGVGLEDLFVRGASRIRRPYEAYFKALHQASGGLVRDALRLWLASIEKVDEGQDFVHIGVVPTSAYGAMRELPDNVLLQLYQIARQGWMNAEVQGTLFRVDIGTAEAQLARLSHIGLVTRRETGEYRITPHLRGLVHRVLSEKGWLK